jgi:hypothetical protein
VFLSGGKGKTRRAAESWSSAKDDRAIFNSRCAAQNLIVLIVLLELLLLFWDLILICSWLRRLFSELEALGMPWRTAEDGGWGAWFPNRRDGVRSSGQIRRGTGGALARETSLADGAGSRSSGRPALTIRTADLQREWRGTGACNISNPSNTAARAWLNRYKILRTDRHQEQAGCEHSQFIRSPFQLGSGPL